MGGATTRYLYDGADVVQEQAGGAVSASLLTGMGIDERFTRTSGGATSTYLTDLLGTTVALTDASGTVQTAYGYDPFGNTSATGSASDNGFQYTGRENDGTGLYFYRARYYNPAWGRFIAEDPIGLNGGINLYRYANNNPLQLRDPTGHVAGVDDIVILSGIGIITGLIIEKEWQDKALPAITHWLNENSGGQSGSTPTPAKPSKKSDATSRPEAPGQYDESAAASPSISPDRAKHILDGDENGRGGGHRAGTGKPGKSEFPADWSDEKILDNIKDVAANPDSPPETEPESGRIIAKGTRDGVDIKVVISPDGGSIITGYPTNVPRNP